MLKGMSLRGVAQHDVRRGRARMGRRGASSSAPITFERRGVVRSLVVEDGHDRVGELEPPRRAARRDPRAGPGSSPSARSPTRSRRAPRPACRWARSAHVGTDHRSRPGGNSRHEDPRDGDRRGHVDTTGSSTSFRARSRRRPASTRSSSIEVCLTVARRRAARMAEIMDVARRRRRHVLRAAGRDAAAARATGEVVDRAKAVDARRRSPHRRATSPRRSPASGSRRYDKLAQMVAGRAARDRSPPRASARTPRSSSPRARAAGCARAIARARSRWPRRRCTRIRAITEVRKTFAQIERARVAEVAKQLLARHRVPKRVRDADRRSIGLSRGRGRARRSASTAAGICCRSCARASVREAEALLAFAHLAEVGVVELG